MCPECGGEYGHRPGCPEAARYEAYEAGKAAAGKASSAHVQAVHDAVLEADAWKQTAARWRKRALREGAPWRRRCAELEEQLDDANERGAELQEKVDELESQLADALRPIERKVKDLEKTLEKERAESGKVFQEYGDLKRRMKGAGTVEALVVERDSLKEQVADLKHRLDDVAKRSAEDRATAHRLSQEVLSNKERIVTEMVNPAKARLRVLATRLGITPSFSGYSDDDKLTAELDRRIFDLMKRAGA